MVDRTYIINYVAKKINAKSYLEIGVDNCVHFNSIQVENKVGVDPYPQQEGILALASDEFFKTNEQTFDIIFIDGLHHADQVYKDIINSLRILNKDGFIFCHDLLPTTEEMQIIPFYQGRWTGDCWKAFVELRQHRDDLTMFVLDLDMGLGVIKRGYQEKLKIHDEINYQNFEKYKADWMNILAPQFFYKLMGETDILKAFLDHFIQLPDSPELNFYLGYYYDSMGQTASAVSFYLRAAERTLEDVLAYESMLRCAMCFETQGCRNNSVIGMMQHAVALMPHRPEGYFFLARFYERVGRWFDSYLIASIGFKVAKKKVSPLRTRTDYPGFYGILFEKAVSGWWCGLVQEAKDTFFDLSTNYPLEKIYREACITNMKKLNWWKKDQEFDFFVDNTPEELELSSKRLSLYKFANYPKLKHKFPGAEKIERNYSEAFQDMFVLTILNGKRNGTYLEIGGGLPFYGNNTYLLESNFEWKGLTLDINKESTEKFFRERNNYAIHRDAAIVDYVELLEEVEFPKVIDYLQLDCEPPHITFEILTKIPFDRYKFAVITFEHDYYDDPTKSYKQKARDFLKSKGYELVVSNVAPNKTDQFEDWYVHPSLVDRSIVTLIKNTDGSIKEAKTILLKD